MKYLINFLIITVLAFSCNQQKATSLNTITNSADPLTSASDKTEKSPSVVKPLLSSRTITVGGAKADIRGFTSEAIQTAIDALHNEENGGTVILESGVYDITGPVNLYDNMALKGSGPSTILKKCKGFRSSFTIDADYGELQISVADATGFRPGMGVAVYDDEKRSGWDVTTAKVVDIKGNTIYINDFLVRDYQAGKNGTLSNACSVISAVNAGNLTISDLTVDGSKESNDMIDGCRAGAIYLHKVHDALVDNVIVKNFNCDGISWQITENVTVRNCEISGCANAGLHPGTGSPFTHIIGNNSHDNSRFGLFVCWRVRNGEVRNNSFHNNGVNGICTGHKDTDILFSENKVFENGGDGINLRDDGHLNEPHRTIIRNNVIENNGTKDGGYGVSVICPAEGVVIAGNTITNGPNGKQKAAIYLGPTSLPVDIKDNKIAGFRENGIIKAK
jgi:hypothetical protein